MTDLLVKNKLLEDIENQCKVKCQDCKKRGFYSYTPRGGDLITCPICGEITDDYWLYNDYNKKTFEEYKRLYPYKIDESNNLIKCISDMEYCKKCNILFDVGCTHAENGCSQSTFNSHLVREWKYRGNIYVGMPCFTSEEEYYKLIKDIEILELMCPNNGIHCNKGCYPKKKFPEYYEECELMKLCYL